MNVLIGSMAIITGARN